MEDIAVHYVSDKAVVDKLEGENLLIKGVSRKDESLSDISQLSPPLKYLADYPDLSEEPYCFVKIKPVEANLSLTVDREKFNSNLEKLKLGIDEQK